MTLDELELPYAYSMFDWASSVWVLREDEYTGRSFVCPYVSGSRSIEKERVSSVSNFILSYQIQNLILSALVYFDPQTKKLFLGTLLNYGTLLLSNYAKADNEKLFQFERAVTPIVQ